MKRSIAAVIIFVLCVILSVYCTYKNNSVLKLAKERIETIIEYCQKNDYENADKASRLLKTEWRKNQFIIETTLERGTVKEIENAVTVLPSLTEEKDADKVIETCKNAIFEIDYLLEKEQINFKNVF